MLYVETKVDVVQYIAEGLRGLAFPKDLRTIATVWWLSFLPDLEGVASAFNVIFVS